MQADVGGKYDWHVDQNTWEASTHNPRMVSVTVQLTPPGDLMLQMMESVLKHDGIRA